MKCKVKDLKVGMIMKSLMGASQILSFEPSEYQKNGKELRVANIKHYNSNSPHLLNYKKFRYFKSVLGKMETTRIILPEFPL